ncbi:YraN family protein [Streptacidiphilus sp. EB103A]|uniref:YraN family protein n=1 Tax=Streptacidiphilus sp. EB103A TaxID=3156275 RepID=UPI0035154CBF
MTARTQALGRYGENAAARALAAAGLTVLDRNWRCREGELDIVAMDGDTLAVCEVKTRSERGFQSPAEAVDQTKANRLLLLAERWLAERWKAPTPPGGVRIDLVSVVHTPRGAARVDHIPGAVG